MTTLTYLFSRFSWAAAALLFWGGATNAQPGQRPPAQAQDCAPPALACAATATPAFAPDGGLWLAWTAAGQVWVARSDDLGRSFGPATAVNPAPAPLDGGPEERPKLVIGRDGTLTVTVTTRDAAYNGAVSFARSTDGGRSFSPLQPLTQDSPSQRFAAFALDPEGALFAAWIDKRNAAAARRSGGGYAGAALAFAWGTDAPARLSSARIAKDGVCECCRIAVAFAGPGRPVVMFRNIFEGGVRDHAVLVFSDRDSPGPVRRVSADQWVLNACPHHGPALAAAADGSLHAAWFTQGKVRKGIFYARSTDGAQSFSEPLPLGAPDHQNAHPAVLTVPGAVHVAWKAFDGERTTIQAMRSTDGGVTWSPPAAVAETLDASDHPLLASDGRRAWLSWLTRAEGYRLIPLEHER